VGYRIKSEKNTARKTSKKAGAATLFLMAMSVLPVGARPHGEPKTRTAAAGPVGQPAPMVTSSKYSTACWETCSLPSKTVVSSAVGR
jgi:hypothetical protein